MNNCNSAENRSSCGWHGPGTNDSMAKRYEKDIRERAFNLAARVFRHYSKLAAPSAAHAVVVRELLRSASSSAVNLEETVAPSSRKDMAAKWAIALREGREASAWARLLATDTRLKQELDPVITELGELVAMMTTGLKNLRGPAMLQPEEPADD
jgi:four helix bundle protein